MDLGERTLLIPTVANTAQPGKIWTEWRTMLIAGPRFRTRSDHLFTEKLIGKRRIQSSPSGLPLFPLVGTDEPATAKGELMTKAELIKSLDSFDDNAQVYLRVGRYGLFSTLETRSPQDSELILENNAIVIESDPFE